METFGNIRDYYRCLIFYKNSFQLLKITGIAEYFLCLGGLFCLILMSNDNFSIHILMVSSPPPISEGEC